MDDLARRADGAAVGFAQSLMAEADTEDGHLTTGQFDEINQAARLVGSARAWGEHQHGIPFCGTGYDIPFCGTGHGIPFRGTSHKNASNYGSAN